MTEVSDSQVLARLIRKWGELYSFWYAGGQYHVERRDNGSRTHGADAAALELAIEEDYRASPPPGTPPLIPLTASRPTSDSLPVVFQ